jgi:uncharacterized protein (TIGR02145 family)
MFKNNTSHFISGDGLSDEYFGFYSKWSSERYYDAKLRVFGKAKKSWGTYLEMTHDGANATIRTDVGDIKIAPAGNIDAGGKRITNVGSPVNGSDVVTKEYLENFLAQLKIPSIVVKDIDGNTYGAVKIGNQIWMAEDLKVTHYPNGDSIPYVKTDDWASLGYDEDGYNYFYDYEPNPFGSGIMYNWAAATGDLWQKDNKDGQGICPDGWHLPTEQDWTFLINYVGGNSYKLMKSGWALRADNSTGFSATPGCCIDNNGEYIRLNLTVECSEYAMYWTASPFDNISAVSVLITVWGFLAPELEHHDKKYGMIVRCIKDE